MNALFFVIATRSLASYYFSSHPPSSLFQRFESNSSKPFAEVYPINTAAAVEIEVENASSATIPSPSPSPTTFDVPSKQAYYKAALLFSELLNLLLSEEADLYANLQKYNALLIEEINLGIVTKNQANRVRILSILVMIQKERYLKTIGQGDAEKKMKYEKKLVDTLEELGWKDAWDEMGIFDKWGN